MTFPPFDWYTFNFPDVSSWLGDVMLSLYSLWLSLWSPLAYLPNASTTTWPVWIKTLWEWFLFDKDHNPNWLGSLNLVQFALGSYLVIACAVMVVKIILKLFTKD